MFTLTQVASFVAIAEEGNFGRAAERLRMTQPPLSRQMQQLEKQLQVRLFDRSGRSVRLTPAGHSFLRDSRRLLHEAENAALSARRMTSGEAGAVRVGFTAASAYGVLGPLLNTAHQQLPHVEVVLHELVTREQLERIVSGTLDLGLVRPPARPELRSRQLLREPLLAALPASHPLADTDEPVPLGAFQGVDVVGYSPFEARYFHELLVGIFRDAGVRPVYVQHVSQVHTVLALVEVGLGVSLVPSTAARLRFEGVVLRQVELPEPDPVQLHLAWREDTDNPALRALLAEL